MTHSKVEQNHILMIDDDVDLNALVTEYLARFGHQLVTSTTATRGMTELRRDRPDLIILDIMLPDTDGLTLCREIRDEFDVPIIMLTARGEVAECWSVVILTTQGGSIEIQPRSERGTRVLVSFPKS